MRTTSTLVGLTLFALATRVNAAEATAAAPDTSAADHEASPAATPTRAGAAAPSPAETAKVAAAPADENAAAAPAPMVAAEAEPPAPPTRRKIQVAAAFLPMALGRFSNSPNPITTVTTDAAFAYGFGLSAGYEVLPHLIVGLAPQAIFNVKEKAPTVPEAAIREYDLMARVAGEVTVVEGTRLYAEVLPGYSLLTTDSSPKGFVIAVGLGAAIDMTDRIFVNVGGGYQWGFQKWADGPNTFTTSTKYLRVALGGGARF